MSTEAEPETTGPSRSRDKRGRFVVGVSGNPAGRPRGSHRESFYRWAESRLQAWLEQADQLAIDDSAMLRFLIEQYMGKAVQGLEVEHLNEAPAISALRELQTKLRLVK